MMKRFFIGTRRKFLFYVSLIAAVALTAFSVFFSVYFMKFRGNEIKVESAGNLKDVCFTSENSYAVATHDSEVLFYQDNKLLYEIALEENEVAVHAAEYDGNLYVTTSKNQIRCYTDGIQIAVSPLSSYPENFSMNKNGEIGIVSGVTAARKYIQCFDASLNQIYNRRVDETICSVLLEDSGELFYTTNAYMLYGLDKEGNATLSAELEYSAVPIAFAKRGNIVCLPSQDRTLQIYNLETEKAVYYSVDSDFLTVIAEKDSFLVVTNNSLYRCDETGMDSRGISYIDGVNVFENRFVAERSGRYTLYTAESAFAFIDGKILSVVFIVLSVVFAISIVAVFAVFLRRFRNALSAFFKKFTKSLRKHYLSYLLLLPTFFLLFLFNYYPTIQGMLMSFMEYVPGKISRFVGFDNFAYVFHDAYFWVGVKNMLILLVTDIIKGLLFSVAFAEILIACRSERFKYITRVLLFLPGIIPGVAGLLIWKQGILGEFGIVNEILRTVGLGSLARVWLADEATALGALVFYGFPWIGGYLIFFGALISVPKSYLESAELEGCSWGKRIFLIDIPLIAPQLKYVFITTFIGSVQNFALIQVMTEGGPGTATYTPMYELYMNITTFSNYGAAAAMGALMFVVVFGATLLNFKLTAAREE